MGVQGLTTFIDQKVPQAINKSVDIIAECNKYKGTPGEKPILVFDFRSLLYAVQNHVGNFLLGGRNNKNLEAFEDLLQRLSSAADLVFYDDGPLKEEKFNAWLERSNKRYEKMVELCSEIEKSRKLSAIMSKKDLPTSGWADYASFEQLAKKYGTLRVAVTKECDAEIAKYANENNVLAIFANDSDFLIFSGKWRYWSLEGLDFESLKTKEYNKEALRRHLELNEEQMRVLSTLAGNDVMQYEDVRDFLNSKDIKGDRFPNIAKYIKTTYKKLKEMKVENVAREVAIQAFGKSKSDLVETSLNQYSLDFEIHPVSDALLRFCLDKNLMQPYSVLKKFTGCLTVEHFDLRKTSCGSYIEAMIDIYLKQSGILLTHRRWAEPKVVYATKKSEKANYFMYTAPPKYPADDLPTLYELLDRENYRDHETLRFKLLMWSICESDTPNASQLDEIPREYFQDVMTLICLTSHGLITTYEADIILSSIEKVETKQLPDDLDKNIPGTIDYRAFQLTFLFRKFRQLIAESMQCVGLYQSMQKLNNFDGLLFHTEYNKLKIKKFPEVAFSDNVDRYRIYN